MNYTKYTSGYTPRKTLLEGEHHDYNDGIPSNVYRNNTKEGGPTNRKMVRLALKHRCLAGGHVAQTQMEVLHCLDDCTMTSQFLILFGKLNGNKFRGLYAVASKKSGETGSVKIYGTGPSRIKNDMVKDYYRYNSGQKSFVVLRGAKSATSTTCAVSLHPGCYQNGRGNGNGGVPKFMQ